jgi:DNA repair protein RadD
MSMTLRPYQSLALAEIQQAYRAGRRAPLLCSPTGSGKSAMTAHMLGRTGKSVLYLCHRAELLDMISADMTAAGLRHGLIGPGSHALPNTYRLHLGLMQTVSRRLDSLPKFDWVISDEAHLAMAPTWLKILRHYGDAWHLGMSATPCRLDGRGLGEFYDQVVYGPSIRELTDRGYLAPCRVFAPALDVSAVRKTAGDFSMEDAARLLDKAAITGNAIGELQRHKPGKRAIVFCCTREHADHVAAQFRAQGIAAVNVDGSMTKAERAARIGDFRAGRITVLTNVDLLTTGFDMPGIEAGIMLRPTQSLALFLQMVGRILRIAPGKIDAVLLDHVGNVLRHGMPDAAREWTLEGRAKRSTPPPVRQCMSCYAAFSPAPKCPACGYVFPIAARVRATDERAGELAEITGTDVDARLRHLREAPLKELLKAAKTREQLDEIRKARGYHHAWTQRLLNFKAAARGRAIQSWRSRAA